MKFCKKCGNSMDDRAGFCPVCGTAQNIKNQNVINEQQPFNPYAPIRQQPESYRVDMTKVKKLFPKIATGLLALIAVIIVICNYFNGRGSITPEGAIKNYYSALNSEDGNKYIKATLSKSMVEAACKFQNISKKQLLTYAKNDIKDNTYFVKDIEIISKKKLDVDEIDMISHISEQTGVEIKVSKAYEITYSYTDISYGNSNRRTDTATVYKSSGKWYFMTDDPFEYKEVYFYY